MPVSQTASGKSFEYALAHGFASRLNSDINGPTAASCKGYYDSLTDEEREERDKAARKAVEFIILNEPRLRRGNLDCATIQSDQAGVPGDVRDIVLRLSLGKEVGISAKVRNTAIRNSRLSPTIDFGERWFGSPCSDDYFAEAAEIWRYLEPLESAEARWRDLDDKADRVYMPLQRAFIREVERQFANAPSTLAQGMMRYMLGTYDYYKVYKHNSTLSIESLNMGGTLNWGRSFPMPSRLVRADMKPGSKTTSLIVLDEGWQLSFRLHNAESRVKRSLKFDVQIIGQPPRLTRHELSYH